MVFGIKIEQIQLHRGSIWFSSFYVVSQTKVFISEPRPHKLKHANPETFRAKGKLEICRVTHYYAVLHYEEKGRNGKFTLL